jgi:adenylate cyclase
MNLSSIAKDKNRNNLSLLYIDSAMALANKGKYLDYRSTLALSQSRAFEGIGDLKKALTSLKYHITLKDSLLDTEKVKTISEMQEKYESEKKERQIRELEVNNLNAVLREEQLTRTRNIYLFTGLGILLLAVGLWRRLLYTRKAKASIQREKDISEGLLLNILPEEIAQELKEKGKADARNFDLVSILFTDFKGFTEQSAKLSASELVYEINQCFEAFDGIMEKYGIEKIKTIGDAYMAAGGLPVPTDESVKNTVLAALEMQAFISKRKTEMDAVGKLAFEMRVGIHTGPVVAGIVGVKKFQYDIWGDTVNTASRMESNGEVGKVNISQATYELLKDHADFVFESRGKIEAKGKGEMEMLFVSVKSEE